MSRLLISLYVLFVFFTVTFASSSEIMIDIAVAIRRSVSDSDQMAELNDFLSNVTNQFRLGDNFTRIGLLECSAIDCSVRCKFTDDADYFSNSIGDERNLDLTTTLDEFWNSTSMTTTRPTALIFVARGDSIDANSIENEIKRLKNTTTREIAVVHLIVDSATVKNSIGGVPDGRKFLITSGLDEMETSELWRRIRKDIETHLCEYERLCRYREEACVGEWWPPMILNDFDCSAIKPMPKTTPRTCEPNECDLVCDRMWPWSNDACTNCAPVNLSRRGRPSKPFLEACPQESVCPCVPGKFLEEEPESQKGIAGAIGFGAVCLVLILAIIVGTCVAAKKRQVRRRALAKARKTRIMSPKLTKYVQTQSTARVKETTMSKRGIDKPTIKKTFEPGAKIERNVKSAIEKMPKAAKMKTGASKKAVVNNPKAKRGVSKTSMKKK